MRRVPRLVVVSIVLVLGATGVAWAVSSPTVVTGKATSITNTSAVLTGTVNPNGRTTNYAFAYGPTTAYGAATAPHSAGSGVKGVSVTRTIAGLTPGTVYHYRISALNGSGSTVGVDRSFTTTGHPPAEAVTGGPSAVGKTVATLTGTIDPEGAATTWVIQYGLAATYGFETFAGTVPAGAVPVPVATQLVGLAPATLFHYRLVAFHGGSVASYGSDATFFTEPAKRPVPRLRARTSPGTARRSPYTFTTRGTLGGAGSIPAAQRCTGNVGIRYYNGRRQLAFVVAPVAPNCTFSISAGLTRLHGSKPAALNVRLDFRGNNYIAPATRTDHVVAG
ncbi:MAG TPA: hypothetical protein VHX62_04735 [Solirubrobacteraceae bacterium]|jgi:hypothetical protein|nr:hypothetical protein [Solirubrobacteraceae bacterium]